MSSQPLQPSEPIPKATDNLSSAQTQWLLAEYSALRGEILQRSANRYQIIAFTIAIAGTILTFGLQPGVPSYVLFVSPILGWFFAGLWAHNSAWTRRASAYIKDHIETKFDDFGWETAVARNPHASQSPMTQIKFSANGVFLGTEVVALGLGLLKSGFTTMDIVLIVIDIICVLATLIVLRN